MLLLPITHSALLQCVQIDAICCGCVWGPRIAHLETYQLLRSLKDRKSISDNNKRDEHEMNEHLIDPHEVLSTTARHEVSPSLGLPDLANRRTMRIER
jgi:hypothetical protein